MRPKFIPISGHCLKCGIWRQSLHRDHILARALGGSDDPSNIQLLCANCHQDKTAEDRKLIRWKWNDESRQRLSRAKKGRFVSDETRKKLSLANIGKRMPEETRKKISATLSGKPLAEEHRIKLVAACNASPKLRAYRQRGSRKLQLKEAV